MKEIKPPVRDLRCKRCLGMGYHGRKGRRRAWEIVNCRRCSGSGECQPGQRNPVYHFESTHR